MRYFSISRSVQGRGFKSLYLHCGFFFLVLGGVDIVFGVFCGAGMCFWCVWFFFWWFVVFLVCSEVEGGEKSRKSKGEEPSVARSTQRGIESDKNHLKWR